MIKCHCSCCLCNNYRSGDLDDPLIDTGIINTGADLIAGIPGDSLGGRESWDLLVYAVSAYGFLLPFGESSWAEFAALIRGIYSLNNPVNLAVYRAILDASRAERGGGPVSADSPF